MKGESLGLIITGSFSIECSKYVSRPTSLRQQHSGGPGQEPDLGERSQHRAVLVGRKECGEVQKLSRHTSSPSCMPSSPSASLLISIFTTNKRANIIFSKHTP